jgi:hypothetical protein
LDNCHYDVTEASDRASKMNATIVACRNERVKLHLYLDVGRCKSSICNLLRPGPSFFLVKHPSNILST